MVRAFERCARLWLSSCLDVGHVVPRPGLVAMWWWPHLCGILGRCKLCLPSSWLCLLARALFAAT